MQATAEQRAGGPRGSLQLQPGHQRHQAAHVLAGWHPKALLEPLLLQLRGSGSASRVCCCPTQDGPLAHAQLPDRPGKLAKL